MLPNDTHAGRLPRAQRPPRMRPLDTLPLFFTLAGKRVVVAGGSEAAAWKAELLSAAGGTVEVRAEKPCAEMQTLAAAPPGGPVVLVREAWSAASFAGAALVVGDTGDEDEAARIAAAARAVGVPVNVIDRPVHCTFQFGAIVNRSPLVVGISTGGAAPVFGQAIRARIEALLPSGFAHWVRVARNWRGELRRSAPTPPLRRHFWEAFAALALAHPQRAPSARDRDTLLRAARARGPFSTGHVALVGAGPGDPELLTLAALRALRQADIILYDDLVAPDILDFARREAKRMLVGKSGYRPSCRQDDINALMVSLAKAGKRVVRLKCGDPLIFGRAGEEIEALERARIPFEIVPGITAAQGAAASLGVSLTQRGRARRLQLMTGHAHDGRLPEDLDLAALADPATTTAIYMPLAHLRELTVRMLEAGASPERPASAVFNATRPDQLVVTGTVADIADRTIDQRVAGPCLVLIGEVMGMERGAATAERAGARIDAKAVR